MNFRSTALSLTLLSLCVPIGRIAAEDTAPATTPATVPAASPATAPVPAAAPAPSTGPSFSGFVDTTYNYNTNDPVNQINNLHSFDHEANTFALNHAQLEVSGAPKGETGLNYVAKIDFGSDSQGYDGDQGGSYFTMEEAYGTYTEGAWGLKVGKFDTYEGIEVIDSYQDVTITRGFLFGLIEPGTHTGAVVTFASSDSKWDIEAGVVNGWDLVLDNNQDKDIIFKIGYNGGDPLTLSLDGTIGNDTAAGAVGTNGGRVTLDLLGATKLIKNTVLNFQVDYGSQKNASGTNPGSSAKWYGVSVQPQYTINSKWTLGGRLEYLDAVDGFTPGTGAAPTSFHLFTISVAPAYQVTPHFLARVEGRYDVCNQTAFFAKDGTLTKKHQGELAAETIFSF